MNEVILNLPGPDEKGFLRRVSEVRAIMTLTDSATVFAMWEAFATYLVGKGYVTAPAGIDPKEAILELSHAELTRIMFTLGGMSFKDELRTVDPQNGGA